jgi:pilus assembly protein CpaB
MAKRNAAPEGPAGDTQAILVAMADIGMGDLLTSQVLKLEQWPKDKVPPGAISRVEDIEGRRTRTKLYANEPILDSKLMGKGASQQGATALIPKGYRVVPVKVDLVSGGSSLILPGDRVDVMVYLVRDLNKDIPDTVTQTILQDIKVFAVNDVLDLDKEKDGGKSIVAKTISLLVTPEQAAKVTLATQLGIVNLVMRSPEDDQQSPNSQAKAGELLGVSAKSHRENEEPQSQPVLKPVEKAPAVAAPRNVWTMRVLKPGATDEVSFEAVEPKSLWASLFGQWKTSTTTVALAGGPTTGGDAKTVGQSAAQEQLPPSVVPPQQPTPTPKKDKS